MTGRQTAEVHLGVRGDRNLGALDYSRHLTGPALEGWDYRNRGLLEEYLGGAVCIVLKLNRHAPTHHKNGEVFSLPAYKHITFHTAPEAPIRIPDVDGRMSGRPGYGCDDSVLIRVVQKLDLVECVATTPVERLRGNEEIFHPLAGCFYSIARGFETNPLIPEGEFEVAILRAVVDADQLPREMIEGHPKVVDSIASYQGERARELFQEPDTDGQLAGFRVILDANSVWFLSDEGFELPFEVRDVMVGPLKL